jgi:hypothetical protein
MVKLREMKLLGGKEFSSVKIAGGGKNFIYNDYHARRSNPGYSRGELGRHFVK